MRIGHGYDVHKFKEGRKCIICGVEIPFHMGLDGHSDADVATHAVMDALLGAAAMGDIGRLFPDNDDAYLGADSIGLLKIVRTKLSEAGYTVSNIDVTIIAQKPKMLPYISQMETRLSEALNTDISNINVKATTEEGLGFTGELLGISAHAVALIEKN